MRLVIAPRGVPLPRTFARVAKHKLLGAAVAGTLALGIPLAGAQEQPPPALSGMWSTTTTSVEHPDWTLEDLFACNCTRESYEYLRELLLPENDHLSAAEIRQAVRDSQPTSHCSAVNRSRYRLRGNVRPRRRSLYSV